MDSVYDLLVGLTLAKGGTSIPIGEAIEECRRWCRLPVDIVTEAILDWAELGAFGLQEEQDRLCVFDLQEPPLDRFRLNRWMHGSEHDGLHT